MNSQLASLKQTICQYTGRKHSFLTGTGSAAIHVALKVIERQRGTGEVILPAVGCGSLTQIVHDAGFTPVFADVRLDNFTLDAGSMEALMTPQTRAVMPIHMFGHAAAMEAIIEAAGVKGISVIEDAAQSIGGSVNGKKMGGFGDFSILSFGGGKIIDAGGGGAVLVDRDDLAMLVEEKTMRLPRRGQPVETALLALSRRNLYHAAVDILRVDSTRDVSAIYRAGFAHHRMMSIYPFSGQAEHSLRIQRAFETLDGDNARRLSLAGDYASRLSSDGLTLCDDWKHSGVLWRYTFLVNDPGKLLEVTAALRRSHINASNHYWSAADLYYGDKTLKNSAFISPRILNLWVDRTTDRDVVQRSSAIILETLQA